jgi:hypothetical protein
MLCHSTKMRLIQMWICESMYVCLHYIIWSKCHTRHTDSCFFTTVSNLAPGGVRQSYWPNLGRTKIFCSQSIYVFSVCMSERSVTFAQYFSRLVFITELVGGHCAVGDGSLIYNRLRFVLKGVQILAWTTKKITERGCGRNAQFLRKMFDLSFVLE